MYKLEYERDDIHNLDFPETSLNYIQRKEIFDHLYLFREISIDEFASKINLSRKEIKNFLKLLIQNMIIRGYYKKNVFHISTIYKHPIQQDKEISERQIIILGLILPHKKMALSDLANILKITKDRLIFELKDLISNGVLIGHIRRDEIYPKWVFKPNKDFKPSENQIEIVGTAMMLRKTDIQVLADLLRIKRNKVLYSLSLLILHGLLELNLNIKTRFLRKNQIIINPKRFIISPDKRELTTLPLDQKEAVGYLILSKKASVKEIAKFIEKTKAETIRLFAFLTAKGTFQTVFLKDEEIRPVSIPEIKPSITIEEMATLSFFNYEALMGVLSTQKKISLRKLSATMQRSEDEIIEAIINLVLEGFVSCAKIGNKIIVQSIYRYSKAQEGSLDRWEKIVLGMVISKTVISIKDIVKSLGVDKTLAREKMYAFFGKGLIKGEIIGSKLVPKKIPAFPPLNQLEDFPIHYQEIFGYLISNSTIKIKKAGKIWNKSKIAIKNIIYELAGAGLISIEEKWRKFVLESAQKYFPSLELKKLGEEYVQIINEIEKSKRKKIKLLKIQQRVNLSTKDIFKIICQLIAQGYYDGTINLKYFVKRSKLILPARKMKCYYCGNSIDSTHTTCPNCSKMQPLCIVCNGVIKHGQEILECPNCENAGHEEHLKKWISIKNECPVCKTSISERNLKAKVA